MWTKEFKLAQPLSLALSMPITHSIVSSDFGSSVPLNREGKGGGEGENVNCYLLFMYFSVPAFASVLSHFSQLTVSDAF